MLQNNVKLCKQSLHCIALHCIVLYCIVFSIGQNCLTDLPADLTDIDSTLVKLDISSNAMRVIPPVVMRLTR